MTAVAFQADDGDVVGKKALCAHLGWARPTLDNRLKRDPTFPVITVGNQTGGWQFSRTAVDAYLRGAPIQVDEPSTAQVLPFDRAPLMGRAAHKGEATARQLKDAADAEWVMDKLRRSRGELVPASAVREVLATVFVKLRTDLTALPDTLAREFGLDERKALAIRVRIEAMMRSSVTELRLKLGETIDAFPTADDV